MQSFMMMCVEKFGKTINKNYRLSIKSGLVKRLTPLLRLLKGGGVAQRLGRRISDQGVPGSNTGRCTFRCGLEQVTFTLLSTG